MLCAALRANMLVHEHALHVGGAQARKDALGLKLRSLRAGPIEQALILEW